MPPDIRQKLPPLQTWADGKGGRHHSPAWEFAHGMFVYRPGKALCNPAVRLQREEPGASVTCGSCEMMAKLLGR